MKPLILIIVLAPGLLADDEVPAHPGVRAELFEGTGISGAPAAIRADREIHFDWEDASPDPRLPPGAFAARWTGRLFSGEEGEHRFAAFAAGSVRVSVGGKVVLDGESSAAGWIHGDPAPLDYGHHEIEVIYRRTGPRGRLGIFWESAAFPLEPLGERSLFQPGPEPVPDAFERGHRLVRRLRCAACHSIPGVPPPPSAPSLVLASRLRPAAFEERIAAPGGSAARGGSMPGFGLEAADVAAIAAFLRGSGAAPRDGAPPPDPPPAPDAVKDGCVLVLTRGCLACHTLEGIGVGSRFAGGALEKAGAHRNVSALVELLSGTMQAATKRRPPLASEDGGPAMAKGGPPPASEDASGGGPALHRPAIPWSEGEKEKVAAFLSSVERAPRPPDGGSPRLGSPERGRELVRALRCAACHEVPGEAPVAPAPPLGRGTAPAKAPGCLEPVVPGGRRPSYTLTDEERRAIEAFISAVHPGAALPPFEEGKLLLDEMGCTSCHARGGEPGIAAISGDIAARDEGLRGLEGALRPPTLEGAGDKFLEGALARATGGELGTRRSWLAIRMPIFRLTPADARAIETFLRERDRVPPGLPPLHGAHGEADSPLPTRGDLLSAGRALAGPDGLGCSSCHDIGRHAPQGIAVTARGPDLLRIGERVHRAWFERWVRDPSRSAPGIEMPGFPAGRKGILKGNLEHQIEALWHVFNADGFTLASGSGAVRDVPAGPGLPVQVIRDVVRRRKPFGDGWIPRAIAVGLPSRHNVVFDADAGALAGWWAGAFARQRTEGKTWWWEPAGEHVLELPAVPGIALERGGELIIPSRTDGPIARLIGWRRAARDGLEIEYSLRHDDGAELTVIETISAAPGESRGRSGGRAPALAFSRSFAVRGAPAGSAPVILLALPDAAGPQREGTLVEVESARGAVAVSSADGTSWTSRPADSRAPSSSLFTLPMTPGAEGWTGVIVCFAAPAPEAPPRPTDVAPRTGRPIELPGLVPGFRAARLPIDESIMPTSLAPRPDGSIACTSLKGDVFALRDTDGDGLEDSSVRIADWLSAPFGVLAEGGTGLAVSQKPEIVRLSDTDGDGFLDAARIAGSGWGFSHDYHDWTFGLVRDDRGWLALTGSDYQQRGREGSSTRLRGKAIRVREDGSVEEVARGLRFAVGIARNAGGEVFFTDNQGEGNPFNEIDHLVEGEAYGTPSIEDPASDRMGGGRPAAIQLPHPWTRSVNGICFLDAGGKFGPFEGHGIGCEYDNAFLIRFTLDRVGGSFQGACYPFSRRARDGGFLGPVACAATPGGAVYVGDLRDSGWGGGGNVGAVVRLELDPAQVPPGLLDVRAAPGGFHLRFTRPVDAARAADTASYGISAYRRVYAGGYATPDRDRHPVPVLEAVPSGDRLSVALRVERLRAGFVYDVNVGDVGEGDAALWPSVAHYTMNAVP